MPESNLFTRMPRHWLRSLATSVHLKTVQNSPDCQCAQQRLWRQPSEFLQRTCAPANLDTQRGRGCRWSPRKAGNSSTHSYTILLWTDMLIEHHAHNRQRWYWMSNQWEVVLRQRYRKTGSFCTCFIFAQFCTHHLHTKLNLIPDAFQSVCLLCACTFLPK